MIPVTKRIFLCGLILAAFGPGCKRSPQQQEAAFLKRGKAFLASKDPSRAMLEFMNAAQTMPKDAEPPYQLGLAYLALHNPRDAAAAFQKAITLDPKLTGAQLSLAELMAGTRKKNLVQQAMDRLQTIVDASPTNLEAVDSLAVTEVELGKADSAQRLLEETLQKSPADLRSAILLSQIRIARGDRKGAQEIIEKAAAMAPRSAEAALVLALFYVNTSDAEKAEAAFQKALQLNPKYAPALLGLAAVQIAKNRHDDAEQTLRRAAALPDGQYSAVHAAFLYQTGRRDQALAELEKIVKDRPNDRVARARLLRAYMGMNKIPQAQALVAAALKKNPKDVDALYQQSRLDLRSGKAGEAIADLSEVVHFEPNAPQVHVALAAAYREQGKPEMERQELNLALQADKTLLDVRLDLASSLLAANKPAEALSLLDGAPGSQRSNLRGIALRNAALLAQGRTQEVRAVLNQVLAKARVPELLLQDALLRQSSKDFAGARASAEEALRQSPEDTAAAMVIAESYLAENQPQKARARLEQIVASHPQSAPLQNFLGEFFVRIGDLAGARSALEQAKAANPGDARGELALARLDRLEKHPDLARTRLRAVLVAHPKNVTALMNLAGIEDEAGNAGAAIELYRAILETDESNVTALNNLAYHLAVSNADEALKLAQRAVDKAPNDADALDTLGWIFYRMRMYAAAGGCLKRAYEKSPTPQRQFHLAMLYIKSGDRNQGQQWLAAALEKDPNLSSTEGGW